MEKFIADFMSLSYGERFFLSVATVYMVVTTIWGLWMIYDEKRESWLAEEKENRSWKKLLKFW